MTDFKKNILNKSRLMMYFGLLLLLCCVEIPEYAIINVKVSPLGSGTVISSSSGPEYKIGTRVTFTAEPANGYRFNNWTGDVPDLFGKSEGVSVTFTISGDKYDKYNDRTAIANFLKVYKLTVKNNPEVGGKTKPDSTSDKTIVSDSGKQVTVTAEPNPGYRFDKWSGASISTNSAITITMDGDKMLNANYVKVYTLTVKNNPEIGGKTKPDSTSGKTTTYDNEKQVTVTAEPNLGYRFDGWSGASTSTTPTVTIPMGGDKMLIAHYMRIYTFEIAADAVCGVVVVTVNGTPITYMGAITVDSGTIFGVTVTVNSGYRFIGWSGVPSSVNTSDTSITFPIMTDLSLIADFGRVYTLTVDNNPVVGGTTTRDGITTHNAGTQVNVTAMAKNGYIFDGWSGDTTSTNNPITLQMRNDWMLTANFTPTYTVTYKVDEYTFGVVPTDPNSPYRKGAEVIIMDVDSTLTKNGCTFVGWTDKNGVDYLVRDTFIIDSDVIFDARWECEL